MKTLVKLFLILLILNCTLSNTNAQNTAITDDSLYTPEPSAMLDVKSINKGVLLPRLTTAQRNLVSNPAIGLLIFDTDEKCFYFYNGTAWENVSSGITNDVIGKTDPDKVYLKDVNYNFGIGTTTPTNKLEVKADANNGIDQAIFNVVNNTGDTIFAVYPQGVRINVYDDPTSKAVSKKGGFAVGGYKPWKGTTNEYLRITPDSIRMYVEEGEVTKAATKKGGFAVGGYKPSKGEITEYFRVTDDSVRIYIDTNSIAKSSEPKGGFAVGNKNKDDHKHHYLQSDNTGFNLSYLTNQQRDAIITPRFGSLVFNTTDSCLQIFLGYWENICKQLSVV